MTKSKEKTRTAPEWLDRALIVCPYYFTVATSEALYRKAIKQLRLTTTPPWLSRHANATAHSFESGEGKLIVVVCIKVKDQPMPQIAGLFAHEAMHIWRWTRKYYGERKPSAEFEAYAVQTLTQRMLEEYERQTKKKKG